MQSHFLLSILDAKYFELKIFKLHSEFKISSLKTSIHVYSLQSVTTIPKVLIQKQFGAVVSKSLKN